MKTGAIFSDCKKYRYRLWRIWDESLPLLMIIGLNPSTADDVKDDATIRKIKKIASYNGYGGIYMMNCYSIVSKDPNVLPFKSVNFYIDTEDTVNEQHLQDVYMICQDVLFAWGSCKVVRQFGIDKTMFANFPKAKTLHLNKNGSPKHPLYCLDEQKLIDYEERF